MTTKLRPKGDGNRPPISLQHRPIINKFQNQGIPSPLIEAILSNVFPATLSQIKTNPQLHTHKTATLRVNRMSQFEIFHIFQLHFFSIRGLSSTLTNHPNDHSATFNPPCFSSPYHIRQKFSRTATPLNRTSHIAKPHR